MSDDDLRLYLWHDGDRYRGMKWAEWCAIHPGGGTWYREMVAHFGEPADVQTCSEWRQCAMDPPTGTTVLSREAHRLTALLEAVTQRPIDSDPEVPALSDEELDAIIAEEEQSPCAAR